MIWWSILLSAKRSKRIFIHIWPTVGSILGFFPLRYHSPEHCSILSLINIHLIEIVSIGIWFWCEHSDNKWNSIEQRIFNWCLLASFFLSRFSVPILVCGIGFYRMNQFCKVPLFDDGFFLLLFSISIVSDYKRTFLKSR